MCQGRDTLGTAGEPRQGKDTANHGAVEEKQQEAW